MKTMLQRRWRIDVVDDDGRRLKESIPVMRWSLTSSDARRRCSSRRRTSRTRWSSGWWPVATATGAAQPWTRVVGLGIELNSAVEGEEGKN